MQNLWFRCQSPRPDAALRLFCFPYAGGSASIYRTWGQQLPPNIEVYAIQLPGRENRLRERPFTNIDALLPELAAALFPLLTSDERTVARQERSFAFFGHSMGAVIAFALADFLRHQQGLCPRHLFVSGRRAPHLPERRPLLHRLPDDCFLEELHQRYQGVPAVLWQEAELRALLLPLLRADLTLVETYTSNTSEPLPCPLTACSGTADVNVLAAELSAWRQHTQGPFSVQMFAGDHFYLNSHPQPLLQVIQQQLLVRHSQDM